MDFQIHCIETEAYGAVLRAFIAQSENLSWGKEELITELRKELRVSDVEHREILGKINSDDLIKSIRVWRKGNGAQQVIRMKPPASDPMFVGQASRKRFKSAQTPAISSPKYPSHARPSPVHLRDGPWNSNTLFPPQVHTRHPAIHVSQDREAPGSGKAKGAVILQTSKTDVICSSFGNADPRPRSDVIEIRITDKLIDEIEKVCVRGNPDPGQIEKARLLLREHERALMDAIGKLSSLSDDNDSSDHRRKQHQCSNEERNGNIQGFQIGPCEQLDRSRIRHGEGFTVDRAERAGIPRINLGSRDYC